MSLRFGPFELDVDAYELRRAGERVPLEPQVLEVLAYLVAHRDRVVRKEELLDEIWGDRFVSESALTTRMKEARRAVDDDGRAQRVIRTVHGRGYQFVAPVEEAVAEPRASGPARPSAAEARLPVPPHAIHGRDAELTALRQLLREARVVSVVGPGGTGKTRLALEVATLESAAETPVVFVELAPVADAGTVADAVAAALGLQVGQRADVLEAFAELFRTSPHLVVLDNCEHVLAEVARLVTELESQSDGLRVLATSREPLGSSGERVFRLGPLPVPEWDASTDADTVVREPVVQLFAERARAVDPEFSIADADLAAVLALCRSLDGLPLAVELAAGRLSALDVSDLRSRLDRRLDLIGTTGEVAGERHRTLRALVDWSYELLGDDQRRLLRVLSVFPAGASLATVEWIGARLALAEDPALSITRLVDASMVVRSSTPQGARYGLLETVRAYGLDHLASEGEHETAADLLVAWAIDFAVRAEEGLEGPAEPDWDARIRQELPNIRAARAELLERGAIESVVELVGHLSEWSWLRPVAEFRRWQVELVDQTADAPAPLRRAALSLAAEASWLAGRLDRAESFVEEADAMEVDAVDDDPAVRLRILHTRATTAMFAGDFPTAARRWYERYEQGGRLVDLGSATIATAYGGDIEAARAMVARAQATATGSEIPSHRAWIHYVAGETEAVAGSGAYQAELEAAIAGGEESGATFVSSVARVTLASQQARSGDVAVAAVAFIELIEHWLRGGNWTQQWITLRNVAELLVDLDDRTALSLWAAAAHDPFAPVLVAEDARRVAEMRGQIVTRVGADEVARVEADALTRDRVQHAEAALAALSTLRDR